jgi:hypothetical protein
MPERFDAVAWMRQQRVRIEEEDRGLSWQEKHRKTLDLLQGDPLYERIKHRVATGPAIRRSRAS